MTPEQLQRFLADLDAWSAAEAAPATTLAYGGHEDQAVELLGPEPGGGPLVLVLHGGFWRAGFTRRNTLALATAFARAGLATANVEYRRLGPGAWRPLLADVRSAAERLGGPGRRVAVGHSAGGHLALWLAAEGLVDAAVTLGGVCDLEAAATAGLGQDAVAELLGGSPAQVPDAYRAADPAARLPLGRPQVLVHGTADDRVPLAHAAAYAERAARAGDDCRLLELDADHFQPIDPRSAVWPALLEVVSALAAGPVEAGAR